MVPLDPVIWQLQDVRRNLVADVAGRMTECGIVPDGEGSFPTWC